MEHCLNLRRLAVAGGNDRGRKPASYSNEITLTAGVQRKPGGRRRGPSGEDTLAARSFRDRFTRELTDAGITGDQRISMVTEGGSRGVTIEALFDLLRGSYQRDPVEIALEVNGIKVTFTYSAEEGLRRTDPGFRSTSRIASTRASTTHPARQGAKRPKSGIQRSFNLFVVVFEAAFRFFPLMSIDFLIRVGLNWGLRNVAVYGLNRSGIISDRTAKNWYNPSLFGEFRKGWNDLFGPNDRHRLHRQFWNSFE